MPFSRGLSQSRDGICVSCISCTGRQILPLAAPVKYLFISLWFFLPRGSLQYDLISHLPRFQLRSTRCPPSQAKNKAPFPHVNHPQYSQGLPTSDISSSCSAQMWPCRYHLLLDDRSGYFCCLVAILPHASWTGFQVTLMAVLLGKEE